MAKIYIQEIFYQTHTIYFFFFAIFVCHGRHLRYQTNEFLNHKSNLRSKVPKNGTKDIFCQNVYSHSILLKRIDQCFSRDLPKRRQD